MPSSHLILCHPVLLLPPIPPSIRVFSSESTLHIRWPKYWSFSFTLIPSKEHPGLISFQWTGWISLHSKGLSRVFSNTAVQKQQFFGAQPSFMVQLSHPYVTTGKTIPLTIQIRCANPTNLSWQLSITETTHSGRISGCRHTKGKAKAISSAGSIIFRATPSAYCPPVIS